jgi:tryptophan synthase alpha chain
MSKQLLHILEFHFKSMSVLSDLFARTKAENRAALIGYMPAGFPTTQGSIDVINAMVAGGVDIVEVGYPYSDPVMDGPVIQRATESALSSGFVAHDLFTVISKISAPTLAMTYWNPIERYGVNAFTERLAQVGGVGVITPDLTIEESDEWIEATSKQGIERVYVVAPSTSDERLQKVIGKCSGFIYAASLMGVTGARSAIASSARELVARIRKVSELPICVGLGVSNAEQARDVANFADGVIVGSAFISLVQSASNEKEAAEKVRVLAQELAQAVTRA